MNKNKKLDTLAGLSLLAFLLLAFLTVVGGISIFKQLGSTIEYKGVTYTYSEYAKLSGVDTFKQAVATLIMLPVATIGAGVLFFDTLLRKEVSHIAVTVTAALVGAIYFGFNSIVEFRKSEEGAGFFYALAAVFAAVMIYFFIKKMLDGDATLGYKICGGACGVLGLFAVCFAYPFLDAYSHTGETIFWFGGLFGIAMLIYLGIAFYVSISSDYDPNPIAIDEFGNPIDNDK